ncbi:hypothetical protein IOQ59_01570 [Pontibacterium sp. N1Y112]|uniref:Uncharacterized protein n=1 Tax=Pontibacterium sinense TaxID=2781979 RepID=A0A8J7F848_9GAMM|nr:DUF6447 family protein [Pontibacterium sinense]MBE9395942.1 hypothetical protein [Pontibacterium sinense]
MSNNINIDGKEYPLELLSESAKGQLLSLQLVDKKIAEAQQQLAILQTARNAYAKELKKELPGEEIAL